MVVDLWKRGIFGLFLVFVCDYIIFWVALKFGAFSRILVNFAGGKNKVENFRFWIHHIGGGELCMSLT